MVQATTEWPAERKFSSLASRSSALTSTPCVDTTLASCGCGPMLVSRSWEVISFRMSWPLSQSESLFSLPGVSTC